MMLVFALIWLASCNAENVDLRPGEIFKFSTPGYPNTREGPGEINFNFRSGPGSQIIVDCDDFRVRVPEERGCQAFTLSFDDGTRSSKFCETKQQGNHQEPVYFVSAGPSLAVQMKFEERQLVLCVVRSTENPEPEVVVLTPNEPSYEFQSTNPIAYFDYLWLFKSSTGEKVSLECQLGARETPSCYIERFEIDTGLEVISQCKTDTVTYVSKEDTIKFRVVMDKYGYAYYICTAKLDRPVVDERPQPTLPPMKESHINIDLKAGEFSDIKSPGYGGDERSDYTDTIYDITATPDAKVQIHCSDMRMVASADGNCEWGDITFDDGTTVKKMCNNPRDFYLETAQNKLKVRMRMISGGSVLCKARSTEMPKATEITLSPIDGIYRFSMPEKPNSSEDLVWSFKSSEGTKLSLQCELRLPEQKQCSSTVLTVYNGKETKTFCGFKTVVEFSKERAMKVRIQVNKYTWQNFKCLAQAITGANANEHLNVASEEVDSSEHGGSPGKVGTTCDCGRRNQDSSRIFQGKQTKEGEYTWMVGIRDPSNFQRCGGSLITRYHVLTAAHCMVDWITRRRNETYTNTVVVIGAHNLEEDAKNGETQYINIKKLFIPDEYFDHLHNYDVSVLLLEKPARFSKYVGPVCMPKVAPKIFNKEIRVTGWGLTEAQRASKTLLTTKLFVMDSELCHIEPWFICTHKTYTDTCSGDSGSPLVYHDKDTNRYTQVSLVSFGQSWDCQVTIGGHTNVTWFYDWIYDKVQRTMPNEKLCTKVE